jgi:hypothetical protein
LSPGVGGVADQLLHALDPVQPAVDSDDVGRERVEPLELLVEVGSVRMAA